MAGEKRTNEYGLDENGENQMTDEQQRHVQLLLKDLYRELGLDVDVSMDDNTSGTTELKNQPNLTVRLDGQVVEHELIDVPDTEVQEDGLPVVLAPDQVFVENCGFVTQTEVTTTTFHDVLWPDGRASMAVTTDVVVNGGQFVVIQGLNEDSSINVTVHGNVVHLTAEAAGLCVTISNGDQPTTMLEGEYAFINEEHLNNAQWNYYDTSAQFSEPAMMNVLQMNYHDDAMYYVAVPQVLPPEQLANVGSMGMQYEFVPLEESMAEEVNVWYDEEIGWQTDGVDGNSMPTNVRYFQDD